MTTIAYHHKDKQIAVDSQSTLHGVCCNYNKIHKHKGRTFILCGSVCDQEFFIKNFEPLSLIDLKVEIDTYGIMIENNNAYYVFTHDGTFNQEPIKNNLCLGSGSNFALSAMDFGKTAKQAVKYATKRDIYSGGKVQVINLK